MAKFKKKKSEAIIETSVIPTKHVKGRPRIANTSSYLALQKVLYGMSKYIQKYTANIGIEGQKLEDFNMRIADKLMRGDRDEFAVSKVLMKTLKLVVVHINKQVFETTKKMLVTLTVHDVTVSGEIYIIQCENKTQLMRMYDISSNIKKWKETHKENPEKLESKLVEKKERLDNLEIYYHKCECHEQQGD